MQDDVYAVLLVLLLDGIINTAKVERIYYNLAASTRSLGSVRAQHRSLLLILLVSSVASGAGLRRLRSRIVGL